MSWRHDHYKTICRTCTFVGRLRISTDGEGGLRTSWAGVNNPRIRHSAPLESTATCEACGSTDIAIEAQPAGG